MLSCLRLYPVLSGESPIDDNGWQIAFQKAELVGLCLELVPSVHSHTTTLFERFSMLYHWISGFA